MSAEEPLGSSKWAVSRSFLWVLASVAILAIGLWIWVFVSGRGDDDLVDAEDIRPAGRWHYQPEPGPGDHSAEDLARVLSLPYIDAKVVAPASSGVSVYDSDRVAPGVNMYVSAHAPEVMLMDADGEILHRWGYTFEEAFPTKKGLPGTEYFRRAHILPNGDLLAIYQGAGMVKLDVDSRLLWVSDSSFYNDFFVAEDGKIWSIAKRAVTRSDIRPGSNTLEDSIIVLDGQGNLIETISLLDAFLESPFADLIYPLPDVADIFHTNTIQLMDGSLSTLSPLFSRGVLLVSLRQVDIVAFVDPSNATPLRAWRGPWVMQHEPTVLPNGRLLVFDNRGAEGSSRVLEFDVDSEEVVWEYRGLPDLPLDSPEAGVAQMLSNGNILITESERGRAVEITRDGEIVWEFVSPHRGGRNDELIATLWEVVRLTSDEVPFAAPLLRR